jgi:hypothetical protein
MPAITPVEKPIEGNRPTIPHYLREKGRKVQGQFYQGGEALPAELVASLSDDVYDSLLKHVQFNPSKAALAALTAPAPRRAEVEKREKKGQKPVPEVGKAEIPSYADTPHRNIRQVLKGKGRHQLPAELQSPDLLLDEEAARLGRQAAQKLVKHLNATTPDLEYELSARGGRAKRGWYKETAEGLVSLFGDDAPRFVALLAATSPNKPVSSNLSKTLKLWDAYQGYLLSRKGVPPTPKQLLSKVVLWHDKLLVGNERLRESDVPNVVRALLSSNPGASGYGVLSGPKVEGFRRNLLGQLQQVTQDVWMARMGGYPQKSISRMGAQYIAQNIKIRRVAKSLNSKLEPGESLWTPAEVQATVWSFFRALAATGGIARQRGKAPSPLDALYNLTHEDVAANADFLSLLLNDPASSAAAAKLGLTKRIAALRKSQTASQAAKGPPLTGPVVPSNISGSSRHGLEATARRAGQYVTSFMGPTAKKLARRVGDSLKVRLARPKAAEYARLVKTHRPLIVHSLKHQFRSLWPSADWANLNEHTLKQMITQAHGTFGALVGWSHQLKDDDASSFVNDALDTIESPDEPHQYARKKLPEGYDPKSKRNARREKEGRAGFAKDYDYGRNLYNRAVTHTSGALAQWVHDKIDTETANPHLGQYWSRDPSEYKQMHLDDLQIEAKRIAGQMGYPDDSDMLGSYVNSALDRIVYPRPTKFSRLLRLRDQLIRGAYHHYAKAQVPNVTGPSPMVPGVAGATAAPGVSPTPQQAPQIAPVANQAGVVASPNTDDNLNFEAAWQRARSGNQKAFRKIAEGILEQLGVKGHTADAVGDWEDGAENSIYQKIDNPPSPDSIRYAAAWYGLLANQRAVLSFYPQHDGTDSLYTIPIPNPDVAAVRKQLTTLQIPFRTIVPKGSGGGVEVVVYDKNREWRDRVAQFAGQYNASVHETFGSGEYLGGSTRTAARSKYRKIIDAYEAAGGTRPAAVASTVYPRREGRKDNGGTGPVREQKVRYARRGYRAEVEHVRKRSTQANNPQ